MALYHFSAKVFSRSGRNTVRAVAYRAGCKLADSQTGETFDYRHKSVEQVELLLPKDAPLWALEAQNLMMADRQKGVQAFIDVVERAEKRMNSQVWKEFEFALHRELTKEQNIALAREFVQDQICARGMAAQLNFHFDKDKETGEEHPHCHVVVTTRHLSEKGMGEKERDWNKKELLREFRQQWQEYSNFHLKLNGHDVRIDHRSNKDRGIELEPQPKLGKGILEQEKKAKYRALQDQNKERDFERNTNTQAKEKDGKDVLGGRGDGRGYGKEDGRGEGKDGGKGDGKAVPGSLDHDLREGKIYDQGGGQGGGQGSGQGGGQGRGYGQAHEEGRSFSDFPSEQNSHPSQNVQIDPLKPKAPPFVTEKMQAFHDTQLRNLYRIMRRPEEVLDIVSKHNSTFMWADVQKILHRYVDELPLFQKLEAKLKNSNELMVLRPDGIGPDNKAIYTTRTLLKAEKSLVEKADALNGSKTHKVREASLASALSKADQKLAKFGGLSADQKAAIHHLVDEGQIKCVVGIAGAGKTTALGVCHDIWKESGYKVYGLAPTGKASKNLEQNGIPSTTLHKFLLSFEEGRCQYNSNSVLVLDEAGMVDMERFEKLLKVVDRLRVKLIVVGDGGQLQPVEAGPAFRLVTQRLGKVELNTVLRQKKAWQREATVLFGKQETQAAIERYMDKGHVHIVQEKLPSLQESLKNGDRESVVKLYEVSTRVSALIYREMMKDCPRPREGGKQTRNPSYALIKQHQDFGRYLKWKEIQKDSATHILKEGKDYLPFLRARFLDPTKMAMLFVNKKETKATQAQQAKSLLKKSGLESLIGIQNPSPLKSRFSIDVRQEAKAALIQAWHKEFSASLKNNSKLKPKSNTNSNALILAFSNRDVNDLNHAARTLLKQSGHIGEEEFTYTISKTLEDDFEREYTICEEKSFSKGDRIVFTQNNNGLGVTNGTMGTIIDINRQKIRVQVDEGDEISFAPKLNPYFDQGWAITIHKSQGTTVGLTYLLASYEMTRNLIYVAMTRHWKNVHVFGSSLDFWRREKLPEVLAKSGEKLSPGDYLDAASLHKLMQQDHQILSKIFERVSNELEAMGTVSKKAFWQVADHFLGTNQGKEKEIRIAPESIREEVRAEELLHNKDKQSAQPSKAPEETKQKNSQATLQASVSGPDSRKTKGPKGTKGTKGTKQSKKTKQPKEIMQPKGTKQSKEKKEKKEIIKIKETKETETVPKVRVKDPLHGNDRQASQQPKAQEAGSKQTTLQKAPHDSDPDPDPKLGSNLGPDSPSNPHKAKEASQGKGIKDKREIKDEKEIKDIKDEKEIKEKTEPLREKGQTEESLSAKTKSLPQQASLPQPKKPFVDAKVVEEALRQNMASFADDIFSSIGEPYNPGASSATQRRYGKKGHISVNLKTGAWIDYKDDSLSGGPLHMLTKLKGLSFKEAVEYGANWAGLSQASLSSRMSEKMALNRTSHSSEQDEAKELEAEQKAKIAKAQALWNKGKSIEGTIAERYLREHRKIEGPLSEGGSLSEGNPPKDLRYLPSFTDAHSKRPFPCLMAGARSQSGEITAVQITYLNSETANKADIEVPKKSFGVIKGSAVTLQEGSFNEPSFNEPSFNENSFNEDKTSKVLFIAEGVETALSLKSAGIKGTIKASLGLSNIKRILPESPNTHFVICADHDAPDSPAAKSLEKSVLALKEYGLTVTVIKPDKLGQDFNDVLKTHGPQGVRDILRRGLPKDLIKSIYPEKGSSNLILADPSKADDKTFQHIVNTCEQRLYGLLERHGTPLTSERLARIPLQAERTATFILHSHGLKGSLPREDEMVQFSMRAKFELDRIPEIQQDLMDEGEENTFRAYRIAERLASIEGRLTFEAMRHGVEPPLHLSYVAKKELAQHRQELPHLKQELKQQHFLSDAAAQNCAQDILRYKETHGANPSSEQIAKMIQISRELENKEYGYLASSRDSAEVEFLRRREGDLLFKHGISHDASIDLGHSRSQVQKSFELIQRQIRQEQEHSNQRELSL